MVAPPHPPLHATTPPYLPYTRYSHMDRSGYFRVFFLFPVYFFCGGVFFGGGVNHILNTSPVYLFLAALASIHNITNDKGLFPLFCFGIFRFGEQFLSIIDKTWGMSLLRHSYHSVIVTSIPTLLTHYPCPDWAYTRSLHTI